MEESKALDVNKEDSGISTLLQEIDVILGVPDQAEILADFNCRMASETEGKELNKETVTKAIYKLCSLCKEDKHNSYGFYLVAVTGDMTPIGCLMISFEMNAPLGGLIYMIQSVYVVKEYRSQGVFRKIFQKAHQIAKEDEHCYGMRLYVETENKVAQTVYTKLGMHDSGFFFDEKDFVFSHH